MFRRQNNYFRMRAIEQMSDTYSLCHLDATLNVWRRSIPIPRGFEYTSGNGMSRESVLYD